MSICQRVSGFCSPLLKRQGNSAMDVARAVSERHWALFLLDEPTMKPMDTNLVEISYWNWNPSIWKDKKQYGIQIWVYIWRIWPFNMDFTTLTDSIDFPSCGGLGPESLVSETMVTSVTSADIMKFMNQDSENPPWCWSIWSVNLWWSNIAMENPTSHHLQIIFTSAAPFSAGMFQPRLMTPEGPCRAQLVTWLEASDRDSVSLLLLPIWINAS